jgi:hypothetical protein
LFEQQHARAAPASSRATLAPPGPVPTTMVRYAIFEDLADHVLPSMCGPRLRIADRRAGGAAVQRDRDGAAGHAIALGVAQDVGHHVLQRIFIRARGQRRRPAPWKRTS